MILIEMEMPEKCEECELEDSMPCEDGDDPICIIGNVGYTGAVRETGRLPDCPLKAPACLSCWHYLLTRNECMKHDGSNYKEMMFPEDYCDEWEPGRKEG